MKTSPPAPSFWFLAATTALISCAPEGETAADPAANEARSIEAAPEVLANVADAPLAPKMTPETVPLTAEGWGALRIGMTLEEVTASAGPDSRPEAAGGPEPEVCDIFHPTRSPEGLRVMIEDGRLSRISISGPTEVKTDRGIGPGDTAAEVKASYRDEIVASPHEYENSPAQYLTVWTTGGGNEPYVRSPEARGIRYEVDSSGAVNVIHAGGPSIQYVEGCL